VGALKQHYRTIAALLLALGIVAVGIAEAPSMAWLRVFGAGFITFGAIGLGVYVGLNPPGTSQVADRLRQAKVIIGLIVAALLFAPVLAVLLAGLYAGLAEPVSGSARLQFSGGGVLVLLLVASVAGAGVAVVALRRGNETEPPAEQDAA
jgi:hypothetical protein